MNSDLLDLANEIEDITDPTAIDKVFFHIQLIQEEDDEFMQGLFHYFANKCSEYGLEIEWTHRGFNHFITIDYHITKVHLKFCTNGLMTLLFDKCKDEIVTWEQPWYQHTTCLTRRLQESNDNETEQYRTDSITKKEDEKIKKNWRKFIKKYDLPDKLVSYARWRNKNGSRNPKAHREKVRRYVASYLARGLQRTIYQVYKHVVSHTSEQLKKHYTPEEEKIMNVCFHHKPEKAVTYLSMILCREPRGIYKRFLHINQGKPPRKRIKWTLEMASKFLNSLIKHAEMPVDKLQCKKFDMSVWLKVQDDMDHSYAYLHKFWYKYLHAQLYVKRDIKLNKIRKKIFKLLRNYPYKVWTDIRWKELVNHFPDGFTHMFLYKICSTLVYGYPNYLTAPLENIIEYGLVKAKKARFKERRLKTLKLNEEGQLEIVKYIKDV